MNVAVYCASNDGDSPDYLDFAEKTGKWIAENGHTLVYGGSDVGLMGKIARTVTANGGKVIGVVPDVEYIKKVRYKGLTEAYFVPTMADRRNKMIELADCYIALPGGYGTLDELSEVICLSRLKIEDKKCAIANVDGFYDPLRSFFDKISDCGFAHGDLSSSILFSDSIEEIGKFLEDNK